MNAAVRAAIEARISEIDTQLAAALDDLARCAGELAAAQRQEAVSRAHVEALSAEHEELTNALNPAPQPEPEVEA